MLGYKLKGEKYVLYINRGGEPNCSKSMITLLLKTKYNFDISDFNFKYQFTRPRVTKFLDSFGYQELYFDIESDANLYIDSVNSILMANKLQNPNQGGRY